MRHYFLDYVFLLQTILKLLWFIWLDNIDVQLYVCPPPRGGIYISQGISHVSMLPCFHVSVIPLGFQMITGEQLQE